MKISKTILKKIKKDNQFSLDLAGLFGIQQMSVLQLAKRKSDKLTQYIAVEYYKSKGYTEDEIFEKEK